MPNAHNNPGSTGKMCCNARHGKKTLVRSYVAVSSPGAAYGAAPCSSELILKVAVSLPDISSGRSQFGSPGNGKLVVDGVSSFVPLPSLENSAPPHGRV